MRELADVDVIGPKVIADITANYAQNSLKFHPVPEDSKEQVANRYKMVQTNYYAPFGSGMYICAEYTEINKNEIAVVSLFSDYGISVGKSTGIKEYEVTPPLFLYTSKRKLGVFGFENLALGNFSQFDIFGPKLVEMIEASQKNNSLKFLPIPEDNRELATKTYKLVDFPRTGPLGSLFNVCAEYNEIDENEFAIVSLFIDQAIEVTKYAPSCIVEYKIDPPLLLPSPHKKESADPLAQLKKMTICPLTRKVMQNPVINSSGITYEETAIKKQIQEHSADPEREIKNLVPNILAKQMIEQIQLLETALKSKVQVEKEETKEKAKETHKPTALTQRGKFSFPTAPTSPPKMPGNIKPGFPK